FYISLPLPLFLSFPTRRSSDLAEVVFAHVLRAEAYVRLEDGPGDVAERRERRADDDVQFLDVDQFTLEPIDEVQRFGHRLVHLPDRKSTRLNSSHRTISYAVFC